jgi:hypothetical protein
MIHQEDIEKLIIAETDLWEDISDDGDGDYDEGTLVLSEEGEVVRDKLLNQKQPEGEMTVGDMCQLEELSKRLLVQRVFKEEGTVEYDKEENVIKFRTEPEKQPEGGIPVETGKVKFRIPKGSRVVTRKAQDVDMGLKRLLGAGVPAPFSHPKHSYDVIEIHKPEKQEEWREELIRNEGEREYLEWFIEKEKKQSYEKGLEDYKFYVNNKHLWTDKGAYTKGEGKTYKE